MEDELDPFDWMLAENLGMTVAAVRTMGNDEYLSWRAFYTWRKAMQDMGKP